MMKKILIVTGYVLLVAGVISCKDKRDRGRAYMPDMAYSVAYETYAPAEERLKNSMVTDSGGTDPYYNGRPVSGTIARGDMAVYHLKNDSTGYIESALVKSPLMPGSVDLKEAERVYLINCGICHGTKLDGNGPLYNDGNGPYSAAPKNLVGDELKKMAEGTMFHSITYGKGQMGSYASQLSTKQRWMVIAYIKSKQFPSGAPVMDSTATKAADSTAVTKAK
jgi:mono/diheme cytochrome c family protein